MGDLRRLPRKAGTHFARPVLASCCERDLIRARTSEGRARAKARGVKMGRPPKLTPHQQREAIKRRDQGEETLADIGRSYNVSAATISGLTGNAHEAR
jgi:DNA invertase Pin-like site-specific DNA recombinase